MHDAKSTHKTSHLSKPAWPGTRVRRAKSAERRTHATQAAFAGPGALAKRAALAIPQDEKQGTHPRERPAGWENPRPQDQDHRHSEPRTQGQGRSVGELRSQGQKPAGRTASLRGKTSSRGRAEQSGAPHRPPPAQHRYRSQFRHAALKERQQHKAATAPSDSTNRGGRDRYQRTASVAPKTVSPSKSRAARTPAKRIRETSIRATQGETQVLEGNSRHAQARAPPQRHRRPSDETKRARRANSADQPAGPGKRTREARSQGRNSTSSGQRPQGQPPTQGEQRKRRRKR